MAVTVTADNQLPTPSRSELNQRIIVEERRTCAEETERVALQGNQPDRVEE